MRYQQHISSLALVDRLELAAINDQQRSINLAARLIRENIGGYSFDQKLRFMDLQFNTNDRRIALQSKLPELSKIYYVEAN